MGKKYSDVFWQYSNMLHSLPSTAISSNDVQHQYIFKLIISSPYSSLHSSTLEMRAAQVNYFQKCGYVQIIIAQNNGEKCLGSKTWWWTFAKSQKSRSQRKTYVGCIFSPTWFLYKYTVDWVVLGTEPACKPLKTTQLVRSKKQTQATKTQTSQCGTNFYQTSLFNDSNESRAQ